MAGPAYFTGTMNIAKNEDWLMPFLYGTQDTSGTFTPTNLTGSTIRLQIRKTEEDHEATVAVNSPDNGITITNAAGGAFTVLLDRPRLVRLAPGDYVFDMVRLLASGLQERICEGTATVVEGTAR